MTGGDDTAPRRLYEAASAAAAEDAAAPEAWTVRLDDKPLRTPGQKAFLAPRAVAEAAAAEWAAQGPRIDPLSMPVTRAVNTAIERIAPQRPAVIADIAAYGGSDLLCHRAEAPPDLVMRQAEAWDPMLDWAAERFGARLIVVSGVMPTAQDAAALAALKARVAAESDIGLAALSELTTISGSVVLALAVLERALSADEAFARSRVDEAYQAEQWGVDAEAAAAEALKAADFQAAARLAGLLARSSDAG